MTLFAILIVTLIPGLGFFSLLPKHSESLVSWLSLSSALGVLWTVIYTFVFVLVHIPVSVISISAAGILPLLLAVVYPYTRNSLIENFKRIKWQPTNLLVFFFVTLFLSLPLLTVHHGLPTGDVQKAIFWGQQILDKNSLPSYQDSARLNRDPSDFLTPGLHALTATVIKVSGDKFGSIAWFSFAISIVLAGLAISLVSFVTRNPKTQLLTFVFAGLNLRFLRYIFSPGYHYQNLIGEMILFLTLILFLFAIQGNFLPDKRKIFTFLGAAVSACSLILIHQFTAFLTVFLVFTVGVCFLILKRRDLRQLWNNLSSKYKKILLSFTVLVLIFIGLAFYFLPLAQKITVLFSLHPHLRPYTISFSEYPAMFGTMFFLLGIFGGILPFILPKERKNLAYILISVCAFTILFLGQGSNTFIDIPSARTIFFAALPLAILAAIFVEKIIRAQKEYFPRIGNYLAAITLVLTFAPLANSASLQMETIGHSNRVNASLTQDTLNLLAYLNKHQPQNGFDNILIDDWNRRRLTWTLLSPYNMVTRIGGDLRVIGDEAKQSKLRKNVYETALDYEKIFMLGNSPIIQPLLEKQKIGLIGSAIGATGDVFQANPLLHKTFTNGETIVYSYKTNDIRADKDPEQNFLLESSTLANDIGDEEDVLPHTAISISASSISEPEITDGKTIRKIQSSNSSLRINVGTYVLPAWDPDNNNKINTPLRLLLRIQDNGVKNTISFNGNEITTFETSRDGKFHDVVINVPAEILRYDDKGFIDLGMQIKNAPLIIDLAAIGINQ